jgi:hypothetical protein
MFEGEISLKELMLSEISLTDAGLVMLYDAKV